MSYTVFSRADTYTARKGLEGPFRYPNGRVIYYDPMEGKYWDPRTDFYLGQEEADDLQSCIFDKMRG